MAKSVNQKQKLLWLQKIFLEKTDEDHPITIASLVSELSKHDIKAERKSLYDDIETLTLFGMDIIKVRDKVTGYYVGSRTFELAEVKLLVDLVQSSKFITYKKSLELIHKLETLASMHEARLVQRQVFLSNRIKTMNESIYYHVDKLHTAIENNVQITFQYFEFLPNKERRIKRDGAFYVGSPLAMMWNDENYYLLAYDSEDNKIKHYRVDKMMNISLKSEAREGVDVFEKIDLARYTGKVFAMFSGEEERVHLRFENGLAGVVLDQFGREVSMRKDGTDHFIVSANVSVSPQFFGWLAGLSTGVKIIGPETVKFAYRDYLLNIIHEKV